MKAIVIGATGLVGKSIIEQLLDNSEVSEVLIFARRSTGIQHSKLIEKIIDFGKMKDWGHEVKGDFLFSALGTTIKAAGSKEAQYLIDHDYQLEMARLAAQNGIKSYVLISSVNASASSPFFYLKMKGELDEEVMKLPFESITILRPGPLKGHRERPRLMEEISTRVLSVLPVNAGMKPVEGSQVAKVAINHGLKGNSGKRILEAKAILRG
jgi:uncharacterized protein YbjT (DUF2867 family)